MQKKYRVNFHTHSIHSDGQGTVAEIIQTMCENNVEYLALTDHDSIAGVSELLELSKNTNLNVFTGVELSVALPHSPYHFHLLSYDFDLEILQESLNNFDSINKKKLLKLVSYLHDSGYNFTLEQKRTRLELRDIALSMKQIEGIKSVEDAYAIFEKYPLYESYLLDAKQAIEMIHKANGLAIMAHPFDILIESKARMKCALDKEQALEIINILIPLGLDGLEVHYAKYSEEERFFLHNIADKSNLLKSAGTDLHRLNRQVPYVDINFDESFLLNALLKRKEKSL